jgi:hypothetical protein
MKSVNQARLVVVAHTGWDAGPSQVSFPVKNGTYMYSWAEQVGLLAQVHLVEKPADNLPHFNEPLGSDPFSKAKSYARAIQVNRQ